MFKNSFENFDASRALLFDKPFRQRLEVTEMQTLTSLLKQGVVQPAQDAMLLVIEDTPIAFLTVQVIHHGVIHGETKGQPWMIAMCKVCNGGACFSPEVDGKIYHFSTFGVYNSMSLIGDDETQTYWDHITGVALHGPHKGYQLKTLTSIFHMNIAQIAVLHPDAQFVLSTLTPEQQEIADADNAFRKDDNRVTPDKYINTMSPEDTRLPRLDMGLGVWSDDVQRYYSMRTIHAADRCIFDTFNGRRILLFIDPTSSFASAIYTTAKSGQWRGEDLYLDNGEILRNGVLVDKAGQRLQMERPLQLMQRWFGFSYSFPGCEIYKS